MPLKSSNSISSAADLIRNSQVNSTNGLPNKSNSFLIRNTSKSYDNHINSCAQFTNSSLVNQSIASNLSSAANSHSNILDTDYSASNSNANNQFSSSTELLSDQNQTLDVDSSKQVLNIQNQKQGDQESQAQFISISSVVTESSTNSISSTPSPFNSSSDSSTYSNTTNIQSSSNQTNNEPIDLTSNQTQQQRDDNLALIESAQQMNDISSTQTGSISQTNHIPVLTFQVEIDDTIKKRIDEKLKECSSGDSDSDSECNAYFPKAVDLPSAQRLAKRLYYLDGFKANDVVRHLSKK